MVSNEELQRLFVRQNLPPISRQAVANIRETDPIRRVGGGTHNVACRFASKKMGQVIQAESHKCELPAIYIWEYDPRTHEFYDQPSKLKLSYRNAGGRQVSHLVTPDFFLIQEDWMGWVECKPEEKLQQIHNSGSELFIPDGDDGWRCPPGEEAAARFGLGFRVISSKKYNWILVRNLEFLSDYLADDCPQLSEAERTAVAQSFAHDRWLRLTDLLEMEGVTADVVYALVAGGDLFADLESELLAEPTFTHICRDRLSADVYMDQRRGAKTTGQQALVPLSAVDIRAGTEVIWDGNPWRILSVGQSDIFLEDENHAISSFRLELFRQLVAQGAITGQIEADDGRRDASDQVLLQAADADLEAASHRIASLNGIKLKAVPDRTLRYWQKLARDGEILYGNTYVGLISRISARGNRNRRVDRRVIELMNKVIDEEVLSNRQEQISVAYGILVNSEEAKGLIIPSEKTFRAEIKRRKKEEIILAREGRRAAYPVTEFIWVVDQSTPRHGERPFEIGHIDHTQIDVEVVDSRTGANLGRPWLTVLMDAFTRSILAFFLTFDPPSYRSCMAVIRYAVMRYGRIPKTIVVDQGSDFESAYFEILLARLKCHKKSRPAAKSRFGSVIERFFGVSNQAFFHNLRGNTQASKQPRRMSPSHNPRALAVWTLPALTDAFKGFVFETYASMPHSSLGISPRAAMERGLSNAGLRSHTLIPYTEGFKLLCLPTTPLGKAKVRAGSGIKIRWILYWHASFRDPRVVGTYVAIRYDPFDISRAYAYVSGAWQLCRSEHQALFERRTEREIATISQEILAMLQSAESKRPVRAAQIAHYLTGLHKTEAVLLQQRRDAELLGRDAPASPDTPPPIPEVSPEDFWVASNSNVSFTVFEELK